MCSTMFLMGPLAQFKKMFEKGRIIATCLYFGAMFLTLWMALKVSVCCHEGLVLSHNLPYYLLADTCRTRPMSYMV